MQSSFSGLVMLYWGDEINGGNLLALKRFLKKSDTIERAEFDSMYGPKAVAMRREAYRNGIIYPIFHGKRVIAVHVTGFGKAWAKS